MASILIFLRKKPEHDLTGTFLEFQINEEKRFMYIKVILNMEQSQTLKGETNPIT